MLCFSITAHERLDVLADQITNIISSHPDAAVVVHINESFMGEIRAKPNLFSFLHCLTLNRSVIVNPTSLATRWAHMFHAHISNFRHVERLGISYSTFILLSSADLIFRSGIDAFVVDYDYGFDGGQVAEADHWFKHVIADDKLLTLGSRHGLRLPMKGYHEGTFYKRELLSEIVDEIDSIVEDWGYNDRYPKEEFFWPTLAFARGARRGPRLSHVLSDQSSRNRKIVGMIIRDFSSAEIAFHPALKSWIDESIMAYQELPIEHEGRHIVSRVPRNPANILRLLFSNMPTGLYAERVHVVLENLTVKSALQLDFPSHNSTGPISISTANFLTRQLRRIELLSLISVEKGRSPLMLEFPPCPNGYVPPEAVPKDTLKAHIDGEVFFCAAYLLDSGVELTCIHSTNGIVVEFGAAKLPSQTSARRPFVFLFFEVDDVSCFSIVGLEVEFGEISAKKHLEIFSWMERHVGATKEYFQPAKMFRIRMEPDCTRQLWFYDLSSFLGVEPNATKLLAYVGFQLSEFPSSLELRAVRGILRN